MLRPVLVCALLCLQAVLSPAASGSLSVARDARAPTLSVNAAGEALVGWTTPAGVREAIVVPRRGYALPRNRFSGPDVSVPSRAVELPMARVVRRTPDGALWALQAGRQHDRGPVELHFSRWRGGRNPTRLSLATSCCTYGLQRLTGRASFEGRPLFGLSPSPAGKGLPAKPVRLFAFLECFGCPASRRGWTSMRAVAPRPGSGAFSLLLRSGWKGRRYRATIAGPNRGWTYAPDAEATLTV